jgi:hypothetical protein
MSGEFPRDSTVNLSSMLLCLSSDARLQMNSPIQHYLNSNSAPSEDMRHQIAQIVAEQDKRISQMDEEIAQLQLLLQPLLRDRRDLYASREAHRQLLNPSRRIPPELWGEIFVQCLPTDKPAVINVQKAPMLMAQVCSPWRSIALSTPRLWNSVSIGGRNGMVLASQSTLISTWLRRSSNLPLFIEIAENGLPDSQKEQDFVNALVPFIPQIKCLTIYAPQSMIGKLIGSQDVSALTNLKIVITNALDGEPLNISHSATSLRNLSVMHVGFDRDKLRLPWAQLTEFDAASIGLDQCFDILRQCHNLSRLCLRDVVGVYNGVIRSPILMPNLVSLELEDEHRIEFFWNNLTLPRLRECGFSFWFEDSWPKSELFALLDRSSCHLCTLQITNFISEEDLVECVERIPTLRNVIWGPKNDSRLPFRVSRMLAQRAAGATDSD